MGSLESKSLRYGESVDKIFYLKLQIQLIKISIGVKLLKSFTH